MQLPRADLVQMLLAGRVEHAEAIVEVGLHVPKNLPGEGEGHAQHVMHVVRGRPMRQVACRPQAMQSDLVGKGTPR